MSEFGLKEIFDSSEGAVEDKDGKENLKTVFSEDELKDFRDVMGFSIGDKEDLFENVTFDLSEDGEELNLTETELDALLGDFRKDESDTGLDLKKLLDEFDYTELREPFYDSPEMQIDGRKELDTGVSIPVKVVYNSPESSESASDTEHTKTKNEDLEGKRHPVTGVLFEKKIVTLPDGRKIEVVVPVFDSVFDVQLPEDLYSASDYKQFAECNKQLKEKIESDPDFRSKFTEEQIEQIMNGETPDGYTWHHDAETGKMQLVDSKIHAQTGHTGGKEFWGGGNDNR